jgi:hypothetical protein
MSQDDVYVIAVKRERRQDVPSDWCALVRDTPGVSILGTANPLRVQIRASAEAVRQITSELSEWVYIEKTIQHERF